MNRISFLNRGYAFKGLLAVYRQSPIQNGRSPFSSQLRADLLCASPIPYHEYISCENVGSQLWECKINLNVLTNFDHLIEDQNVRKIILVDTTDTRILYII